MLSLKVASSGACPRSSLCRFQPPALPSRLQKRRPRSAAVLWRIPPQQLMTIPEGGFTLAVEEEAPVFGGGDVANRPVHVKVVLEHVGVAALPHPVIGGDAERERPSVQHAVSGGGGEIGACREFAVADARHNPGAIQTGRNDDLLNQIGDDLIG